MGSIKSETNDKIELSSEKVRNILGEVPNIFIRWGISILCILFVIIIAVVMSFEYPHGHGETIFEHLLNAL